MSRKRRAGRVVLAINPTSYGFGYAVFQDVQTALDWGRRVVRRDKNEQTLKRLRQLIDWYQPSALVLPDVASRRGRRSARIEELFRRMERIGKRRRLVVAIYSRQDIRAAFAGIGARTKDQIAHAIADQMPEFELWLPPKRKAWTEEDRRMCIFDATSLVFTFFHFQQHMR